VTMAPSANRQPSRASRFTSLASPTPTATGAAIWRSLAIARDASPKR
jgi:hypothetical protein